MRYILLLIALFLSSQICSAQSNELEVGTLINLGHGIFLETTSPNYITVLEDPPDYIKNGAEELVIVPATYETITETVVVQGAHSELKVTPAIISNDGSIQQKAAASLVNIPEVTKKVSRRVVKTPARAVKRVVPYLYTPRTVRKRVKDTIYIFRNQAGEEIKRYESPVDAMRYIEGLPN